MTKSKDFVVLEEYIKHHPVKIVLEGRYTPKGEYGVCMLAQAANIHATWSCNHDCKVFGTCNKIIDPALAPSLTQEELCLLTDVYPEYFI